MSREVDIEDWFDKNGIQGVNMEQVEDRENRADEDIVSAKWKDFDSADKLIEDLKIKDTVTNIALSMGDKPSQVTFHYTVTRNIQNRIKYWLFCKFFPFKITRWDK